MQNRENNSENSDNIWKNLFAYLRLLICTNRIIIMGVKIRIGGVKHGNKRNDNW